MNLIRYLLTESIQGVVDLKLDEKYGCETIALLHWEQLHGILLPDEVKNFYLASNGFEFTWKFRLGGTGKLLTIIFSTSCFMFH